MTKRMQWSLETIEPTQTPYLRVERYRVQHHCFDGGTAHVERDVLALGEVAAVVAVDTACDAIVMIEQFRIGAAAGGHAPWLLEFVAGTLEAGESIDALARRELQEEAGLVAERVEPIARYFCSPGVSSERVNVLVAKVDSHKAGGVHGLPSEGEDIRVAVRSIDELPALIADPRCGNSLTLIGLMWLQVNYQSLKHRWQT
ncbi:NUDIX domain-containing protein [Gammaproteobacteria bacterium]|nr:NUDIX domain-containing protein [Gammaproteobacteria bacterium]